MTRLKQYLPLIIAGLFGWLTLLGLLIPLPEVNNIILGWAALLVAFALVLGVLNLFVVHLNRFVKNKNIHSFFLVITMISVFIIAIMDARNESDTLLTWYFTWIQAPMEAALASLLAFFLLFAGFQMMKRQRTVWTTIFLLTAVFVLAADVLLITNWLPTQATEIVIQIEDVVRNVIVLAGVRGILIGVALGTIMLAVRMLIGMERPYNK